MEIGVSTACFYPCETEYIPQKLRAIGVHKAEIFLNSASEYRSEFCAVLRNELEKNQIQPVSVHSFVAMHEPFLFSTYTRRADDAEQVYRDVIRAAKQLGAKYHTFHGARKEMLNDGLTAQKYGERLSELADIAYAEGVTLCLENVYWCVTGDIPFLKAALQYVKSPHLGFTLDTKQARRAHVDYREYLSVFGDKLKNVHVSDCAAMFDCLLPGTGQFDFPLFINQLKSQNYEGDLIVEVYNNAFAHLTEIQNAVTCLRSLV